MKKIAIIGPGLLGGTVALAVRQHLPKSDIGIWARRDAAVAQLQELGFSGEEASMDLGQAIAGADLIILATPIGIMPGLARQMVESGKLAAGAIITDVGSVKGCVVEELTPIFEGTDAIFLGSHPMAGSEKTGLAYAKAELLQGARCILTPTEETPAEVMSQVQAFWEALGMRIAVMEPDFHDQAVARISHLPHAAAAMVTLAALTDDPEIHEVSAGGFRDTTRVAGGSPEMWAEILLQNRAAVLSALADLQVNLSDLLEFLEKADEEKLVEYLRRAKELRDLLKAPQPPLS